MPVQDTSPKLVQFGVFELDLQQGELRKQGVKVKLQDQPLKILQLLLETHGEIVSRDQLRSRIWSADTFVEFDKGLHSAIARLRDALGELIRCIPTRDSLNWCERLGCPSSKSYSSAPRVSTTSHEEPC